MINLGMWLRNLTLLGKGLGCLAKLAIFIILLGWFSQLVTWLGRALYRVTGQPPMLAMLVGGVLALVALGMVSRAWRQYKEQANERAFAKARQTKEDA